MLDNTITDLQDQQELSRFAVAETEKERNHIILAKEKELEELFLDFFVLFLAVLLTRCGSWGHSTFYFSSSLSNFSLTFSLHDRYLLFLSSITVKPFVAWNLNITFIAIERKARGEMTYTSLLFVFSTTAIFHCLH